MRLFGTTALKMLLERSQSFTRFSNAVDSAKEVAFCCCVEHHFFCIEAHLDQFRHPLGLFKMQGTLVDSFLAYTKHTRLKTFQGIAKRIQGEIAAPTSSCNVLEAERAESDTRCFSSPSGLQFWWSGTTIDEAVGLGSCKLLLTRGDLTNIHHDGIGLDSRLPQHLASATKRCTTKTCTLTLEDYTTGKAMYLSKGGIHDGDVFASVGEKQETCNVSVNDKCVAPDAILYKLWGSGSGNKSAFGTAPLWIRIVYQRGTI